MSIGWKIYRTICILQMLGSSIYAILSLIGFFQDGTFSGFLTVILFIFMFMLTILAINILNNNYPDVPVTGKQKSNFNRLFLVNFLFLVLLFGIVFSEYRELILLAAFLDNSIFILPFRIFLPLISIAVMLIFQLIILYGLYELRKELSYNFSKKEFEFEKNPE